MTSTARDRARRRWKLPVLVVLMVGAGVIAALPWILRLPLAQRRLAAAANAILAPSSVEFDSIRLSWFQPTQIANVVLRDAQHDRVLAAPRAVFQWNLRQILFAQPSGATLTIDHGDLDIERFPDGRVDLLETLKPVIAEHPRKQLVIRIVNGRLRVRDRAFPEPIVAHHADVMVDLSTGYQPITWKIQLARDPEADEPEPGRLEIAGNYSRSAIDALGRHDLTLSLRGTHWPWTLASSGIEARGAFGGSLDAQRRSGRLLLSGDMTVTDLVAIGDLLSSDTIHLDSASGRWKVEGGDGGWTIDQLELNSPLGSLEGHGSIPVTSRQGAWFLGTVDLAALAKQLPATLRLRDDLRVERGIARLRAELRSSGQGLEEDWAVTGKVSDLIARQGQKRLILPEPATLEVNVHRNGAVTALERLELQTPFLSATGHGDLDGGVALAATIDLAAFRERFRDWIDLGAIVLGGQGKLDASFRRSGQKFQARAGGTFRQLRIDGLAVVSRFERDLLTFDAELSGRLAPSGWPLDWTDGSLRVRSEPAEFSVKAQNDATGKVALSGRAQTRLQWSDQPRRLQGELEAIWDQSVWTAKRIALAVIPLALAEAQARGGQDRAIRWVGKGSFDPRGDVLLIESSAGPPQPATDRDYWLDGNQSVHIKGLKSLGSTQIDAAAKMDLASIGSLLAPNEENWTGQLDTQVRARARGDLWDVGIRLELRDPGVAAGRGAPVGPGGPVVLGVKASYAPGSDQLELAELALKAPYVAVEGAGVVRNVTTRADLELQGALSPDWDAIRTLLAQKVEPKARIAGRPRAWRISGPIASLPAFDRLGSLQGEVGVQIDALDVFGMRLSDVPVVARAVDGRLRIDPIDGSFNGGALHLEPELVRDKNGSIWLHLGPASKLSGAIINDEVSHRVLSFAAPVLDGATRVQGRVSVELADAVFPIVAAPEDRALIKGDVLFDNVRFMPGPLADQLLSVFQKERKPLVVIRDPISVRITGRKVYQEGLIIPVANLASIGLDGSVDFDKNLDLVARFAMNPPRAPVPVLTPILENARFELPIRGTLKDPKIDGEALKERWKSIGIDLLGNSMEAGVNGLQKLFQGLTLPRIRRLNPPPRRVVPPPPPAAADSAAGTVPDDRAAAETEHQVMKPPARSAERTKVLPEERRQLRERRRRERLQKKADRQLKQSQTPG